MKIAFVTGHLTHGGAEKHLLDLLDGLDRSSIERVVCLGEGWATDRIRERGVDLDVIQTGRTMRAILHSARRLRRVLRRSKAEIVHANGVKAALVCALAMIGSRKRLIWVKHDFSRGWLTTLVASRCARVVVVSSALIESLSRSARRKARVVHNGIDIEAVDRTAGRRLLERDVDGAGQGPIVALVGRLDPFKGHRELIAVASVLVEKHPCLRIVFVGAEDPAHIAYREELEQDVDLLHLGDVVHFLGFRSDAVELMSGCDVVAIPSIADPTGMGQEGFSYVGLEAMAVGTPIVAYAHGGLPELLGDCGILVPPGNSVALGQAIADLLDHREKRSELAGRGVDRAARFSVPAMVEGFEICYRELTEAGRES